MLNLIDEAHQGELAGTSVAALEQHQSDGGAGGHDGAEGCAGANPFLQ